jgi:hypothetical protein
MICGRGHSFTDLTILHLPRLPLIRPLLGQVSAHSAADVTAGVVPVADKTETDRAALEEAIAYHPTVLTFASVYHCLGLP